MKQTSKCLIASRLVIMVNSYIKLFFIFYTDWAQQITICRRLLPLRASSNSLREKPIQKVPSYHWF